MKDHNIPRALNFGIINSKSDIIARIDADDFAVENKIEIQFKYLTENKSVDIVGTNFYYYTNTNRIFGQGILPEHHKDIEFLMPVISTIAHPTVMMRKNALSNVGMYNPDLDFSEDLELFLRLFKNKYNSHNIQIPLYYYRIKLNQKNAYPKDLETVQKSYELGKNYLEAGEMLVANRNAKFDLYFRLGLLNYYKGTMSNANKYFIKSLLFVPGKFFKIVRYLMFSLLGTSFMNYIRKHNITFKLKFRIIKHFKRYHTGV